jgi:hypothetical protein
MESETHRLVLVDIELQECFVVLVESDLILGHNGRQRSVVNHKEGLDLFLEFLLVQEEVSLRRVLSSDLDDLLEQV